MRVVVSTAQNTVSAEEGIECSEHVLHIVYFIGIGIEVLHLWRARHKITVGGTEARQCSRSLASCTKAQTTAYFHTQSMSNVCKCVQRRRHRCIAVVQ